MRNIKKILKEDDIGDMGIGAMIVFIAMVLGCWYCCISA